MTPGEAIKNEAVSHRIALNRYSTALVRKVLANLNRSEKNIVARLERAHNEGRDPTQLENLLREIKQLQADGWTVVRDRLDTELTGLAGVERDFATGLAKIGAPQAVTNAPTTAQVIAAVKARPFQGRFLREWLSEAEAGAARRVRDTIRQGFIEGRSVGAMVALIRGTRARQYRDGILEINRRGAEALVRTAVTHTAALAATETYRAMGDLVTGVEWVATLDSRTTDICAGRDGKVYPLDSGPRPPAHINCRSTVIPRIKGVDPVERTTYAEWLKKQTPATQDDILGPSRAALFRSGGVKIEQFTDTTGKTLTLEQLKAKDSAAFAKSGLSYPIRPPRGEPQDDIAVFLRDKDEAHHRFLRGVSSSPSQITAWFNQTPPPSIRRGFATATKTYTSSLSRPSGSVTVYQWVNQILRDGTGDLEGRKFAAMVREAVVKLPRSTGQTFYRGIGAASDAKWARYGQVGQIVTNDQIASVSSNRAISTSAPFIKRGGTVAGEELRGIVFVYKANRSAHNVQPLAALGTSEAEWIIVPGQRHRVTAAYTRDGIGWIEFEDVDD